MFLEGTTEWRWKNRFYALGARASFWKHTEIKQPYNKDAYIHNSLYWNVGQFLMATAQGRLPHSQQWTQLCILVWTTASDETMTRCSLPPSTSTKPSTK